MINFELLLNGGGLRSIGKSNAAVTMVDNQQKFDDLFSYLLNPDRKVVMRTADAIEKISLSNPDYLQPHKHVVLQLLEEANDKELKWHVALLASRLVLSDEELGNVWQSLSKWATDKNESRIVRVNALQGLFVLLQQKKELQQDFLFTVSQVKKENIPSINARVRKFKLEPGLFA